METCTHHFRRQPKLSVEREPMWDGNFLTPPLASEASRLSENQCGMETAIADVVSSLTIVEREPMWDGNSFLVRKSRFIISVEREPMWDGNLEAENTRQSSMVEREPMWDGNCITKSSALQCLR